MTRSRTGWPQSKPRTPGKSRVDIPLEQTWLYRVGSAEKRAEMEAAEQAGSTKRSTK